MAFNVQDKQARGRLRAGANLLTALEAHAVDDCNAAILAGVGVCEHRDGMSGNRANGSFTSTPPSAPRK